jgi:hypothetical protein
MVRYRSAPHRFPWSSGKQKITQQEQDPNEKKRQVQLRKLKKELVHTFQEKLIQSNHFHSVVNKASYINSLVKNYLSFADVNGRVRKIIEPLTAELNAIGSIISKKYNHNIGSSPVSEGIASTSTLEGTVSSTLGNIASGITDISAHTKNVGSHDRRGEEKKETQNSFTKAVLANLGEIPSYDPSKLHPIRVVPEQSTLPPFSKRSREERDDDMGLVKTRIPSHLLNQIMNPLEGFEKETEQTYEKSKKTIHEERNTQKNTQKDAQVVETQIETQIETQVDTKVDTQVDTQVCTQVGTLRSAPQKTIEATLNETTIDLDDAEKTKEEFIKNLLQQTTEESEVSDEEETQLGWEEPTQDGWNITNTQEDLMEGDTQLDLYLPHDTTNAQPMNVSSFQNNPSQQFTDAQPMDQLWFQNSPSQQITDAQPIMDDW